MRKINFRTLRADEIEVCPSYIKDGKVNLLLDIKSTAIVSLLNDAVGNLGWQSRVNSVNGQLIVEIGIYDEERGEWVWKVDTTSECNKGADIYKCVLSQWGIDELYTIPIIQVPHDKNGYNGYKISEIEYNEQRKICHLVVVDNYGKEVYRLGKQSTNSPKPKDNSTTIIQLIKDRAYMESKKGNTNKYELEKFVKFYTSKVEKEGWRGDFRFDDLFAKWMKRCNITN